METGKEEHVKAIVSETGITIAGDREDRLTGTIAKTGIIETVDTIGITKITGTTEIGIVRITGIIGTMVIGITATTMTGIIETTGITENIVITAITGIITGILIVANVGKDVPRMVTVIIVFKIGIVTSTGEMIAGRERIGKIEVIVGKDLPNDREDHLMVTGVRKACTARKNK
jgi:hypothetical protein